jgi:hypothetical protein
MEPVIDELGAIVLERSRGNSREGGVEGSNRVPELMLRQTSKRLVWGESEGDIGEG